MKKAKTLKDKTLFEKYAENYLKKKGYAVELVRQYQSKTVYDISKDNITDRIELPTAVDNKKKYMEFVDRNFKMKAEISELKSMLKHN